MRRKRKRRGSDRTQPGSDRTHPGSDRTQTDGGDTPGEAEEGYDPAARYMEPSEGWWTSYGFESLGEYLRYSETGPDRPFSFGAARKKKAVPAPDLPVGGSPPRPGQAPTRQISIRLDEDAYQRLRKVARQYGVAPATMGRLLVAEGTRKAVDSS